MKPALVIEKKQEYPILIVDKNGFIGEKLAERLQDDALIVLVCQKDIEASENIIHIPFHNKFPTIPDNFYSHIIIIDDNNEATNEALPSFIKKAEKDRSLLFFAVPLSDENEKIKDFLVDSYSLSKIIVYGDIVSKSLLFQNKLNNFINEAENLGRIDVPGDGMQNSYPVLLEDLIEGFLEALFYTDKKEKVFYILPKHPVTYLTFAHIIQKIIPGVSVDFVKNDKKEVRSSQPKEGNYLLGESYRIEEKIKTLDLKEQKQAFKKTYRESFVKRKKQMSIFGKTWIAFSVALLILLPIITTAVFSFMGYQGLKLTQNYLEKGDSDNAVISANSAENFFNLSQKSLNTLIFETDWLATSRLTNDFSNKINKGKQIAIAAGSLAKAASLYKRVYVGKAAVPEFDFNDSVNNLRDGIIFAQKQQAEGEDFGGLINKSKSIVGFASSTIDLWPDLLGINEKKIYLVLFQNNMELRPGGGFIGSYGILTMDKGRISDFKIHDVYDADGQLKTHIEPPFAIRRILKIPHLYLRDSNFDPDFTVDAAKAAMFLNLELNQKVNGVIGVDLNFVKNLLEQIGPITVTDYNEKVDSSNFFALTESHAEKNTFPGSTQKKDFLKALFNSISQELTSARKISYLNVGKILADSIDEKNVLFAFDKGSVQNIFTINSWSSSLLDTRQESQSVINDYLGINEANIGVNKVNYFIRRSFSQNIVIGANGQVSETVTLSFKNTSDGAWPGGDYTNYIRMLLPLNSKVTAVEIDGVQQSIINAITDPIVYESKTFKAPSGLEIEETKTGNKSLFGFLVKVPTAKLTTVKIKYDLPKKISFAWPDFTYDLKIYKQPGVDTYPYAFSISYPKELNLIESSEKLIVGENKISYSGQISKDKDFILRLGKK
jgi:hypothetical protein